MTEAVPFAGRTLFWDETRRFRLSFVSSVKYSAFSQTTNETFNFLDEVNERQKFLIAIF